MNSELPSTASTRQYRKSTLVRTLPTVLFAAALMALMTMTSCKTRKMSQERQYERLMEMDSCGVTRVDVRDLSVTDIVVVEFDSLEVLDRCADLDVLNAVGLEVRKNIKRIVHIHRQNDIQTTQSDSTIIQVKDSLKSNEIVQNKSSPDKASQAIFSTTTIIIMLIIILALIFFIKFTFR